MSDGKDGAFIDNIRKTYNAAPNINPSAFRQRLRFLPQMIVGSVMERASRLRYLGPATFDNRPHQVVSYSNEDGLEIALYFDEKPPAIEIRDARHRPVYRRHCHRDHLHRLSHRRHAPGAYGARYNGRGRCDGRSAVYASFFQRRSDRRAI